MSDNEFNQAIMEIVKKPSVSVFERNIIALATYIPELAKMLYELEGAKHFEVFIKDEIESLNIICRDGSGYLYNDPKAEVEGQILEFSQNYALYPALFFYGLGNGVLIKKLLENPNHQTIIVFEPELEILYIVLNLIDFSDELAKQRFVIANSFMFKAAHYQVLCCYEGVFKSARIYNLYINSVYYAKYKDDILNVNVNFGNAFKQRLADAGNDATDTLNGINNNVKHIPAMIKGIPLSGILKKRKGKVKTAIIASTGPSLTKQLPILKSLQGHATIISADSSYSILKKHGIIPDFVTSIERYERTSEFFNSQASEFDNNIIFMLATLTDDKSVEYMNGRHYALTLKQTHFEAGFQDKDFGYIGGAGHSCAHLAFELALQLEHKNIIFIGQDLAYADDGSTHPDGYTYGTTDEEINGSIQEAPAYGGNGYVKAWKTWNVFRYEFETNISAHLATAKNPSKIYNATEGGARIAGTIEKPFKELAGEIINETKPEFSMISPLSKAKQAKKLVKFSNHIKKTLDFGKELGEKCENLFKRLASAVENAKAGNADYTELQNISNELERLKNEDLASDMFIDTYYLLAGSMLNNEALEFTKISVKITHNEDEEKAKLLEWVSAHGAWLFNLTGTISVMSENLEKYSKEWII